jgi:hypothetical protein
LPNQRPGAATARIGRHCARPVGSAPAIVRLEMVAEGFGGCLALSWPNLPCALKAAIGIGKQTLGTRWQSAAPQGPQQARQPAANRPTTLELIVTS